MKYLTITALIVALSMPLTAFADDAWDAECAGTLSAYVNGANSPENAARAPENANHAVSADEFRRQGVVDYGGREETWYSSTALYHYRTGEWTADEDGFYRTDEGYYVVASDAYEQGAIIETSRGLAQVLDSGCGDGVDFYCNW